MDGGHGVSHSGDLRAPMCQEEKVLMETLESGNKKNDIHDHRGEEGASLREGGALPSLSANLASHSF